MQGTTQAARGLDNWLILVMAGGTGLWAATAVDGGGVGALLTAMGAGLTVLIAVGWVTHRRES
ncbi:MAG: hypothetical protein R3B13_14200 [Polyangiaceae bacterium]